LILLTNIEIHIRTKDIKNYKLNPKSVLFQGKTVKNYH